MGFDEILVSSSDNKVLMEQKVAVFFHNSGSTLSLAESCSGGLIAKRITDIPGASAFFLLGLVTYANSAKTDLLGVSTELLERYGAVSAETASAMANGVRELTGSTIAVATTGIAGPDGGTPAKPVGTVYIAIARKEGCQVYSFRFSGGRKEVRESTADKALDLLFQHL